MRGPSVEPGMHANGKRLPLFHAPAHSGRGLFQQVLLALAGAAFLVFATVFLTLTLVAGSLVAAIIALRWWWGMRRLRARNPRAAPIDGEFTRISNERIGKPHVHS